MSTLISEKNYSAEFIAEAKKAFSTNPPYPHVVIDNFLTDEAAAILHDNFPTADKMRRSYKNINENKSEGSGFEQYHPYFQQLREELGTERFRKTVEAITGINDLILPDDQRGSGVHQGFNGSYLDVHVDFTIHPVLKLHRRLNLLIFLNKNWKEEYGGHLELWDKDVKNCIQKYQPGYNRAVIFECNDISYHGYNTINIPETESRKSFFCYYFTEVGEGVKYHDTIFKARPEEGLKKKIVTDSKEYAKNVVKKALFKMNLTNLFKKYE
jgi:hypothetical protein